MQYGFGNSALPGHALQIMTISAESTPGLRVDSTTSASNFGRNPPGAANRRAPRFSSARSMSSLPRKALPSRTAVDLPGRVAPSGPGSLTVGQGCSLADLRRH
jgi:hypothetical protein